MSVTPRISSGTPALVLAPMDGVTDALMRQLLTSVMPFSFCVTEFIRVSGIALPSKTFLHDVPELAKGGVTESGAPVQVQLLGGDPEKLAESAVRAVSVGAMAIDLNFGCPAPTVNRHDGGATLLKYPDRIERIVSTVRAALPHSVPLSAKLRLGWDDPTAIHVNAERAARGGAAWITIHGRTKFQGYTPPAYWRPIGEVRRQLDIPVVANGEIWSVDDLRRCQDESGCEHIMIGRGALAEPGLVTACAAALGLPRERDVEGLFLGEPARWVPLLERLVALSQASGEPERRTLSRIKQWLNYARHKGKVEWFCSVKRVESLSEMTERLRAMAGGVVCEDSERVRRVA